MAPNRVRALAIFAAASSFFAAVCTSLRTIEVPLEELQQRILAGEIVTAADRILVVTSDEEHRRVLVTGVDQTSGHGKKPLRVDKPVYGERPVEQDELSIPIDDILAMKTPEFSVGKTALPLGGAHYFMLLLIAGTAAAFL